jgi:hypothetical protein
MIKGDRLEGVKAGAKFLAFSVYKIFTTENLVVSYV